MIFCKLIVLMILVVVFFGFVGVGLVMYDIGVVLV